ncbi:MAG: TIGR02679 family protein [Eubacteriaceae bacterium]
MMLHDFVAYLKSDRGYHRILEQMRNKYQSLGHLGGTIRLEKLTEAERNVLRSLLRKDFSKKSASFSLELFIAAFEQTRYAGLDFKEVLPLYFDQPLSWTKEVKNLAQKEKADFFKAFTESYQNTAAGFWLSDTLQYKDKAYAIINRHYKKDPRQLSKLLNQVCQGLNKAVASSQKVRLPLFSSQLTRDPHAFDMNREEGRLLLYALCHYYKSAFPRNAEEQMELLYSAGLIYDEVSNYTVCRSIMGYNKNQPHPGYAGFFKSNEPFSLSLWNLSRVDRLTAVGDRVYVFENPTVFSEMAGSLDDLPCSLVCSSGNVKVATLILLDLLIKSGNHIYYAGDLDPEELVIADKLKKRYQESLTLWRFTCADYEKICSSKKIPANRLKKLEKISSVALIDLALKMKDHGYSAYQELLVADYLNDIAKWQNNLA